MSYVLVVDFGSQYTHLICRRIRQLGRECMITPWTNTKEIKKFNYNAIILSGGPKSVYEKNAPIINKEILDEMIKRDITILAICYGFQLISKLYGGEVSRGSSGEYGQTRFLITRRSDLFKGLPNTFNVWMSHGDIVNELPKEFHLIGKTENLDIAAFEWKKQIFGLQFHPEVGHTEYGIKILENFLTLARIPKTLDPKEILKSKMKEIASLIGNKSVALAASGGVDSTVLAALLRRSIKGKVYAIVIDTGFLREGEIKEIIDNLRSVGINDILIVDARDDFYSALIGISDPEEKRRKFSNIYARVMKNAINSLKKKDDKLVYFAQGTIYPDIVESGKGGIGKDKIKSHHNVIMETIEGIETIEPLRDLYKDEVRELGKILGLPNRIIYRKPFPGPGLAIRIVGEISKEKIEIIRKATKIVEEELEKYERKDEIWQAFPVLLETKTTGIKGDKRAYGYTIALRIIESEDAMTAKIHEPPFELLKHIASRITREIHEVVRVLYDITDKPPATIEYE